MRQLGGIIILVGALALGLNLGPSGRPPVGLAATIDSLEAAGWGASDELPTTP
ncbi:MAG: hypothetical protein AB7R55_10310 [Gemmatimonadales bacterium]